MPVTLSNDEIRGLQAAAATLLSPLDYPTSEAWLAEACCRVLSLLGADQALTMIPLSANGGVVMGGCAYDLQRTVDDYCDGIMQLDTGLHVTRRRLGIEVYHRRNFYETAAFHRNPVYGDWAVPHRLMDVIGIGYNPVPGQAVAALHFYHDRDHEPEDPEGEGAFGARGLALLQLLLPAWKAGVRQHLTFNGCRDQLGTLVDLLEEGVALYDTVGREQHRNPALARLLAADPDGGRIESLIRAAARRLTTSLTDGAVQTIVTATAHYALETSQTSFPALGLGLVTVVVLRREQPRGLTAAELRARFRLTARECEVAQLLAAGRSNLEIATALAVTHHTARRHTEAVLGKLAVRSRAAVGPVLRGERKPQSTAPDAS